MTSATYIFGNGRPRVRLPAELTSEAKLLSHLKVSKKELNKINASGQLMYRTFEIHTKKKTRTIFAPDNRLKHLQREITSLLSHAYTPRNSTHGFVRGRSIASNAEVHAGKRHLLSLDLKDFFPSITTNRVFGILRNIGIPQNVCTIIVQVCCVGGSLPQGAPSSPLLSNLICFSLDRKLQEFSKQNKLVFTRYADDVSISTNGTPIAMFAEGLPASGKVDLDKLSNNLKICFSEGGFELNSEKTHFASGSARKIVTGLITNEFPNVRREFLRNIRATMYDIEKRGYAEAQRRYHSKYTVKNIPLENYLRGKLNFVGSIRGKGDPTYRSLADRFNKLFDQRVTIERTPAERLERAIWVVEWKFTDAKIDQLWAAATKKGKDINAVADSFQGTAFFMEGIGLVTADHCLAPSPEDVEYLRIWHPSDSSAFFDVFESRRCPTRDAAILNHSVPSALYENLTRYRVRARGGDRARAYGYTDYQKGDPVTSSVGEISHLNVRSTVKFLNLSFKVGQGMSGGPVVDDYARVIGMIHKGGPDELRDYAVVIDEVFSLASE